MGIKYACGCLNAVDTDWGVLRSVFKCDHHRQMGGKTGLEYYREMGAVVDGIPQCKRYVDQLLEAMPVGSAYVHDGPGQALEIGCGFSMYAPWLLRLGYTYTGIDIDQAGVAATEMAYRVDTRLTGFEELPEYNRYELILAAHCLEHFTDAPAMLQKIYAHLLPGGELWLVIPDDSDPVNPDHLWFFTEPDIRRVLERIGFAVAHTAVKQYIEREKFIYVQAIKPIV